MLALVLVVCVVVCMLVVGVSASRPADPWFLAFEDSDRVFVMVPDIELDERFWGSHWIDIFGVDVDNISVEERQAWSYALTRMRPGLYYRGTPPVNIYYYEGWLWDSDVFFAGEGIYFANLHKYPIHTTWWIERGEEYLDLEVVKFFANGVQVRSYRIRDLITDESKLVYAPSGLHWIESLTHDPQTDTITLKTVDGHTHFFDIIAGERIDPPEISQLISTIIARSLLSAIVNIPS